MYPTSSLLSQKNQVSAIFIAVSWTIRERLTFRDSKIPSIAFLVFRLDLIAEFPEFFFISFLQPGSHTHASINVYSAYCQPGNVFRKESQTRHCLNSDLEWKWMALRKRGFFRRRAFVQRVEKVADVGEGIEIVLLYKGKERGMIS